MRSALAILADCSRRHLASSNPGEDRSHELTVTFQRAPTHRRCTGCSGWLRWPIFPPTAVCISAWARGAGNATGKRRGAGGL